MGRDSEHHSRGPQRSSGAHRASERKRKSRSRSLDGQRRARDDRQCSRESVDYKTTKEALPPRDYKYDRSRSSDSIEERKPHTSRHERRRSPSPLAHQNSALHHSKDTVTKNKDSRPHKIDKAKEAINMKQTGALLADQNSYRGIVLKYSEPPEARKPTEKYRLYVFKGTEQIDELSIYKQSAYLLGRERLVADIPIDHPSCSMQHAILQYRQSRKTNEFGDVSTGVKPYLIDLATTNGTYINGIKIPVKRYVELKAGDVLKFGDSSRDYVFMSEDAVK